MVSSRFIRAGAAATAFEWPPSKEKRERRRGPPDSEVMGPKAGLDALAARANGYAARAND